MADQSLQEIIAAGRRRRSIRLRLFLTQATATAAVVLFRFETSPDWLGFGPVWLSHAFTFALLMCLVYSVALALTAVAVAFLTVRLLREEGRGSDRLIERFHDNATVVLLVLAALAFASPWGDRIAMF